MFRNDPGSGLTPEDDTMIRSEYQLWPPPELATNGVSDMQYFGTDEVLFESSDALEYNDVVLKSIDTECKEPFNADDIIDSCMNRGSESSEMSNGAVLNHEQSRDRGAVDEKLKIELPSDPASVLQALSNMLDGAGGVDSNDSIFVKIMESSALMPVQCILINVLRATNKSTLKRLLGGGAWSILHGWLLEARSQNNKPLMLEILQLCKLMPVTTKLLKSNSCAKDIKQLIKHSDERISRLAKVIVDDWVSIVTGIKNNGSKTSDRQRSRKTEAVEAVPPQPEEPVSVEVPAESGGKSPADGDHATDTKERPRPKTVKALPIKFRSTGLECIETENNAKPRVKPSEKSSAQKPFNSSASVSSFLSRPVAPSQQPPRPSKIKIIPARPLQPELSEKSPFLDALKGSSSAPTIKRKRKAPTSPTPKAVPSVSCDLNKDEIAAALKNAAQGPTLSESENVSGDPSISENEVVNKRAKTKKSVSWASENDLCDYFYFEVDPDERVNVNKIQSSSDFNDHRRQEIEMERRALSGMCHSSKKGLCLMEWRCPSLIEGLPKPVIVQGAESKEKLIQLDREAKVLQVIYFSHDSVPDSPSEPDEETIAIGHEECRIIPLDDEEEPMETEPSLEQINSSNSSASLPPILSNLFGNIINQSPNIETNASASPVIVETEGNYSHVSHSPDSRYNYNQPGNSALPNPGPNFHPVPRNDFNFQVQQYNNNNQRDRYNYPEEYNGHYRMRGPAPQFHHNDFGGRGSGPRHAGFGTQVCQFFMAGNCRFGTNCRNLHPR